MDHDIIVTGPVQVNTYIFDDGKHAIVVDPGGDADKIIARVQERGCDIAYIVITHAHFDHVGAVADLKAWSDAKIYMSKLDYDLFANDDFITLCGISFPVEPFDIDVPLVGGEKFVLCGHSFEAIATPGHTRGGMCYIVDDKILLSGDTLFELGVGRTDLRYGDFGALMDSLDRLFALPHDYTVLPGHGGATTLDFERKHNPYAKH